MAAAARDHPRQHRAGHVEQALDVGVDHLFPVLQVGLVDLVEPAREPRVVDQDVHRLPAFGQGRDGGCDCLCIAHVQHDRVGLDAVLCGQFPGQRVEAFLAARGQDQVDALGGQRPRGRRADARSHARHERNLTLQ